MALAKMHDILEEGKLVEWYNNSKLDKTLLMNNLVE